MVVSRTSVQSSMNDCVACRTGGVHFDCVHYIFRDTAPPLAISLARRSQCSPHRPVSTPHACVRVALELDHARQQCISIDHNYSHLFIIYYYRFHKLVLNELNYGGWDCHGKCCRWNTLCAYYLSIWRPERIAEHSRVHVGKTICWSGLEH